MIDTMLALVFVLVVLRVSVPFIRGFKRGWHRAWEERTFIPREEDK
jgi:hypothetical protein